MKIIDETSNAGRQIVPEDLNYLSKADLEVVSAMEKLMKAMAGVAENAPLVVSGCEVSWDARKMGQESRYEIGNGVLLWKGVLWTMAGMVVSDNEGLPQVYDTKLSVVFDRTSVVAPSPVYGMTLELDQTPHKEMTARVVLSTAVPKGMESVPLGMLRKMPQMGIGRGLNDLLRQTYIEEGEA